VDTPKKRDDDGDWDYTFIEETIGIGGMLVRDGVGTPVSTSEALQWTIDDPRDVTSLDQVMRNCLFALSSNDPEMILVALRGIVALRADHAALPHREALIARIEAASSKEEIWFRDEIQAAVPLALQALGKA
jgi:hypothetical protein